MMGKLANRSKGSTNCVIAFVCANADFHSVLQVTGGWVPCRNKRHASLLDAAAYLDLTCCSATRNCVQLAVPHFYCCMRGLLPPSDAAACEESRSHDLVRCGPVGSGAVHNVPNDMRHAFGDITPTCMQATPFGSAAPPAFSHS